MPSTGERLSGTRRFPALASTFVESRPEVGSPSAYRNENVEQLAGRPPGHLAAGVFGLRRVTHVRGLPLMADSADTVYGIALQRT